MNDINKIINNLNNNNEKNNKDELINNNEENINKTIDIKINTISKLKDSNNNIINLGIENNYNENNKNLFTNSLFNDYGININNNNEINNNIYKSNNNLNNSCENDNINSNTNNVITTKSSKTSKTNILKSFNNEGINKYESPSLHFLSNKLNNNKPQNVYKNFQNIFSEIENYQINYEKMKKENDARNSKINNLLEKKIKIYII